jgi:hypothetical protein
LRIAQILWQSIFAKMPGVDYSEYSRKTANRKAGMLTELAVEYIEALENTSQQLLDLPVEVASKARWKIM